MLSIKMFPCLMDNYGFLIHDSESGAAACIDTPEAVKINAALSEEGWSLTEIWNTHHRHTTSHIIYHIPSAHDGQGAAFVGDTIFVMGCGRLFEGSPADMFKSMTEIANLPGSTKLYCAHEYTLSNGKFALTVEPENTDMEDYMKEAKALRDKGLPTVPTTVAREAKINPFMRAASAERLGAIREAKDNF